VIVAVVLIVLSIAGFLVIRYGKSHPAAGPHPSREAILRAGFKLHQARRQVDVALARSEQRRAATQFKREISETLEEERSR
jgi:hypothetical protein